MYHSKVHKFIHNTPLSSITTSKHSLILFPIQSTCAFACNLDFYFRFQEDKIILHMMVPK